MDLATSILLPLSSRQLVSGFCDGSLKQPTAVNDAVTPLHDLHTHPSFQLEGSSLPRSTLYPAFFYVQHGGSVDGRQATEMTISSEGAHSK